jgi:di/tricarboxylate transporter
MVFMMVQAVLFGIGIVTILMTPLSREAATSIPWMVLMTFLVSAPLSWLIAPRLQMRFWRRRGLTGDSISG